MAMPVNLHSRTGDDEGDEARIEVIPLIDIMFFLLAAFMLVSLSMTGVPDSKTPPFQIAIDVNGVTTWDGKIVTPSEITARLKTAASPVDSRVLISADEDSRHKQVLGVLNAVREAGVEKVSFETRN
jgi:biopolymer transport protein ExbD